MPKQSLPIGQPLSAIGFILVSHWCLSTLDASGKWVMSAGVPVLILVWVRYSVHFLITLGLVVPSRGWKVVRSQNPAAQLVRAGVMLLATAMFFMTLRYLPMAQATAINFLAPLLVLMISPWLLHEPRYVSRWIAAGVAFLGMLIIIRPGGGLDPVGTALGLLTACCFAGQFLATRRVAQDDPFTTLIWSGMLGAVLLTLAMPFLLPAALPALQALGPLEWAVLVSTGLSGALGHLFQIQAFRRAPASLLSPFMYVQIVAATTIGWLIWGDFPDHITWVGIGIICLSGMTIAVVEWRRK